ncbi:MAG TPA: methyltransferase domain-containing protein [Acidobacteriota bacterium]
MSWVCILDRGALDRRGGGWSCHRCGRCYPESDGIPIFARDTAALEAAQTPLPQLEALPALMRAGGTDAAAESLCRSHGCFRRRPTCDWSFFLPLGKTSRVLELGGGFGDDTCELSRRAAAVVCLEPRLGSARIVDQRRRAAGCENVAVAVAPDLAALPLQDGSVAALVLEDDAAAGFGLSDRTLPAAAAEWHRVLEPGGAAVLVLNNPRSPLRWLRPWSGRGRARSMRLNRWIKRAAASAKPVGLSPTATVRTLRRLGFADPILLAPFPDQDRTRLVLALGHPGIVRYGLDSLVRRHGAPRRLGLALAEAAAGRLPLPRLLPCCFLIAPKPGPRPA